MVVSAATVCTTDHIYEVTHPALHSQEAQVCCPSRGIAGMRRGGCVCGGTYPSLQLTIGGRDVLSKREFKKLPYPYDSLHQVA